MKDNNGVYGNEIYAENSRRRDDKGSNVQQQLYMRRWNKSTRNIGLGVRERNYSE